MILTHSAYNMPEGIWRSGGGVKVRMTHRQLQRVKVFEIASLEKRELQDVFKVIFKYSEHYQTTGMVALFLFIHTYRERGDAL